VYLHQNRSQRLVLFEHVNQITDQMLTLMQQDAAAAAALQEPQTDFRRTEGQGYYSALDIVTDLWHQLDADRDATQGMVGRWNRLFAGTAHVIEFVLDEAGW
jgi:hypothetical protein